jgi:hypothetical protein
VGGSPRHHAAELVALSWVQWAMTVGDVRSCPCFRDEAVHVDLYTQEA